MKPETQLAWAIDSRSTEGHGLIGRFWQIAGEEVRSPQHVLVIRLFATRAEARAKLARMQAETYVPFPSARVVRVRVTVETTP